MELREMDVAMPYITSPASQLGGVSVRTAKATFSALLETVARGREILITSDGRPKARLVPVNAPKPRKVFGGSAAHLATMPPWSGGLDATELISADRDGR